MLTFVKNYGVSVIARQSIKYTLISYFSYGIGILSSIFLYPNNTTFYGITQFVMTNAEILMPFLLLGFTSSLIRFYPDLQEKKLENASLIYSFVIVAITSLLCITGFYIAAIIFPTVKNSTLYKWVDYTIPLAIVLAVIQIFTRYTSIYKRIVVPAFFNNLMLKVSSIIAFVSFVYVGFSEYHSLFYFVVIIALSAVGFWVYTFRLTSIQFDNPLKIHREPELKKQMLTFAFFAILGGIGNTIALRIDKWMIGAFFDMKTLGNYAILLAIITLLSIPTLGIFSITAPIIAKYFKEKQFDKLNILYKKTTLYLFFLASFLFCLIIAGSEGLFFFMNNGAELLAMRFVLIVLGFSTLVDVATGFNSQILAYSPYYKYNMYTVLGLAFVTILTNYLFIHYSRLGILGVSIATLFSMAIFNSVKCWFIYKKYNMQPFSLSFVYIIATVFVVVFIFPFLPGSNLPILDSIAKGVLVLFVFFLVNYFAKIVDLKTLFSKNWKSFITEN